MVIPNQRALPIQASAVDWGPQSHRSLRPRATPFPNPPKAYRTPWRSSSRAAQQSPIFVACQPDLPPGNWFSGDVG